MSTHIQKYNLKDRGRKLERTDPHEAILYYEDLKCHEYFINDYYPYRRLVLMYGKIKDQDKKLEIIEEFFKSGIYCNRHNFLWFKYKMQDLRDRGFTTQERIDELSEYFKNNSLKNKNISNTPLPIADRIKKQYGKIIVVSEEKYNRIQKQYEYEVRCSELNRQKRYPEYIDLLNCMIDEIGYRRYDYFKKLCVAYRRLGDEENELRIIERYFNGDSTQTKASDEWFKKRFTSLRELNKDTITFELEDADLTKNPLFEYDKSLDEIENLKRKAVMIEYGRLLLEKNDYNDAILYYKYLCANSYFSNDWYPYRQLTVIYEKTEDHSANLVSIKKLLYSKIHLNEYQFIWFSERIRNLMEITDVRDYEIQRWLDYYEMHGALNEYRQNKYLADRFKIKGKTVSVMNDEKFNYLQKICALAERGRIYESVGNYSLAITHYSQIISQKEYNAAIFYKRLCDCFYKNRDYENELEALKLYYTNPPRKTNSDTDECFKKRLEYINEKLKTNYKVEDFLKPS